LVDITHTTISVIIPTYNRKHELEPLLHSLNHQTLLPSQYEIIVVDDGSTDETTEWLTAHKDQFKVKTSFYTKAHGGPGAARNLGMEMAAGDIFAFIDTDCIAQPEWLEQLIKPFISKKVGAVGGRESINEKDPLLMRCFHYLMISPLTTGGLRGKKGKTLARFYPRTFNMAISRGAYQATGGFKKMFYAEDIELSYRIRHKGFDLTYQDSAQVYHRRRSKISQFVMQLFHMGKARVTLARLHPSSLEFLHVLPALALTIVVLLSILSLTWQPAFSLLKLFWGFAILLIVLIGIDGALRLHSFRALFLTPLLFMLQQAAYGSGFLISLLTPKR